MSDTARSTPAYHTERQRPAGNMLYALRWHTEGELAFARCRTQEHMELANAQLTQSQVRTIESDKEYLTVTVLKKDLTRAFPQLLNQRTL